MYLRLLVIPTLLTVYGYLRITRLVKGNQYKRALSDHYIYLGTVYKDIENKIWWLKKTTTILI